MQSSLQRVTDGAVRRIRVPPNPKPTSGFRQKAAKLRVELYFSSTTTENSYGNASKPAEFFLKTRSLTFTNTTLSSLITAQALGFAPSDLVAGSLQFSLKSVRLWAAPSEDTADIGLVKTDINFPRSSFSDERGTNARAAVGISIPKCSWAVDNANASFFSVSTSGENPISTTNQRIAYVEVTVLYQIYGVSSKPPPNS